MKARPVLYKYSSVDQAHGQHILMHFRHIIFTFYYPSRKKQEAKNPFDASLSSMRKTLVFACWIEGSVKMVGFPWSRIFCRAIFLLFLFLFLGSTMLSFGVKLRCHAWIYSSDQWMTCMPWGFTGKENNFQYVFSKKKKKKKKRKKEKKEKK